MKYMSILKTGSSRVENSLANYLNNYFLNLLGGGIHHPYVWLYKSAKTILCVTIILSAYLIRGHILKKECQNNRISLSILMAIPGN